MLQNREITVLLADDSPLLLESVQRLLQQQHCRVIGIASDGAALVREAKRLLPDVLVVDISMPVVNGLQALRILRSEGIQMRAVILSVHDEREIVAAAMDAGACGYVLKSNADSDLIDAIRAAIGGTRFLSRAIDPKYGGASTRLPKGAW